MRKEEIEELIAVGKFDDALAELSLLAAKEPQCAEWEYLKGRALWKLGKKGPAISAYEHAVELDPQSPAKHALEMSRQIMDFFHPDMFNP